MTKEESFEIKEQKGRGLFALFASQNNIHIKGFADDKFARWDVAYTYQQQKIVGEIKVRNNSSYKYKTYMMEVDKLLALQAMCKKRKDLRAHYINVFENNNTYIWDITDLNLAKYKIEKRLCNKNDWDDEKIYKQVIFLDFASPIIKTNTDENNPEDNIFYLTPEEKAIKKEREENEDDDLPF